MDEEEPLSVTEALAGEYAALRPDSFPAEPAPEDARELYRRLHTGPAPLSALCISGGGIRSATFALGAVQSLAEHGLLEQFDYLSTVSGGGYLGGWLTAWKQRAGGLGRVIPHLCRDAPAPVPGAPDPIRHLREYNAYLSPRRGGFSADVWTLVATVLSNILLNWMVLLPLLLVALLPPRFFVSLFAFPELIYGEVIFPPGRAPDYTSPLLDRISGSPWVDTVLPLASAVLFATAWFNILRCLPGVGNRPHTRADYVAKILAPLAGAVFTFLLFDALYYLGSRFTSTSNLLPIVGWTIVPAVGAWVLYLLIAGGGLRRRIDLLFSPLTLAIPSMAAGLGVAAWLTTNYLVWSPNPQNVVDWSVFVTVAPTAVLLGFYFGTAIFRGLVSGYLSDEDREWMSRAMAGVLLFCAAWTLVSALVLVIPGWVLAWKPWQGGLLGLAGGAGAWLSSRPNPEGGAGGSRLSRLAPRLLPLAPALFLCVLAIGLSIATNALLEGLHRLLRPWTRLPLLGPHGGEVTWLQHERVLSQTQVPILILLALGLLAYGWFMARYVNINTFSLHGMYRDRLIRAYLGASNPERQSSAFTGFAPNDNLPMASLDPQLRPLHLVNLTLNLVGASRLDWQERKAQPFTVSPLTCGNAELGYRPTSGYGGRQGISLGTAIAISGAAASPNMGSFSTPAVGFVMTLFNARLGAWLGNPGPAGEKSWRHSSPKAAIGSLFKEALGLTNNESEYVYLSDGGHFENFGLYEMVRRRCRRIVVLDGGADLGLTFADLGNALRKIRIDLRVPIDFHSDSIAALRAGERRAALATIRYSTVDGPNTDGLLLYVKPLRLGTEPPDVDSYAKDHPDFPHQSTANQWFNESQTESYRQLGLFTLNELASGWIGGTLADFLRHVEKG